MSSSNANSNFPEQLVFAGCEFIRHCIFDWSSVGSVSKLISYPFNGLKQALECPDEPSFRIGSLSAHFEVA